MAISVSIQTVDAFDNCVVVSGKLLATGSYVTGGDTVNFTTAVQDPLFQGLQPSIPSSQPPSQFLVQSQGGNLVNTYSAIIGTQQTNCKLKVSAASTFGTEFSAGAYSAAILADNIGFSAVFPKFV
jgi:hypothetical protein